MACAVQSYPIRGRIISFMSECSTLLVRHSEVPGVMRAMTMGFKVVRRDLQRGPRGPGHPCAD